MTRERVRPAERDVAGTLPAVPPYFLTTPIYYVNDAPHVGTAYTTVNADALARWHRLLGDDVWFMTGTDEHGAKIVEAAEANGTTPKEWTDRTSARFVEAWRRLDIAYDDFIRTTEPRHYAVVQQFLQRVYDNGFIELATYSGLYCVACEDYYTEDQLVDGLCPVHGRPVIEMEEENYFFKLSAFEDRLLEYYDSHPDFVRPVSKRNEALGFIRGGLRDVSITRTSFTWGVPVPWDSGHVFYVWYDALINYLTVAGFGDDEGVFEARWAAAHHLIGKDILKFHCVWWPAMCMAAGIEPPAEIFVHGYLLMGGQKLGKTMIAAGVAGDGRRRHAACGSATSRRSRWPTTSAWIRCAITCCATCPLGGDGDFSYEGIVARYNADLANNLGNLVSRVTTVVHSKCGGIGPACAPGAASLASRVRGARAGDGGVGALGAARGARGDVAPHRCRQRGARGGRAVEDGPRPGGRRRARRRARSAAHRGRADRAGDAVHRGRGLAPDRRLGRPERGAPARGRGVGRLRRRDRGREGRPAVPPAQGLRWAGSTRTATSKRSSWAANERVASEPAATAREARTSRRRPRTAHGPCPSRGGRPPDLHRDRRDHLGSRPWRWPGPPPREGSTPRAWASIGLHPHEASEGVDAVADLLARELAAGDGAVVAVGECGLDYYYEHSPRQAHSERPLPRRSRWRTRTASRS